MSPEREVLNGKEAWNLMSSVSPSTKPCVLWWSTTCLADVCITNNLGTQEHPVTASLDRLTKIAHSTDQKIATIRWPWRYLRRIQGL